MKLKPHKEDRRCAVVEPLWRRSLAHLVGTEIRAGVDRPDARGRHTEIVDERSAQAFAQREDRRSASVYIVFPLLDTRKLGRSQSYRVGETRRHSGLSDTDVRIAAQTIRHTRIRDLEGRADLQDHVDRLVVTGQMSIGASRLELERDRSQVVARPPAMTARREREGSG